MIDTNKIILMTKFAIYDKKFGYSDRKINGYFMNDYVYRKNSWTRLYVFFGCMIVLFFYWLHKIVIDQVDILTLNFKAVLFDSIVFVVIVMVVYTLIGSKQALTAYNEATRRLKNYDILLNRMDRLKNKVEASSDGADVDDAGNDD